MEIPAIVLREIDSIIDAEGVTDLEIIFVVEQYIKARTGRIVKIDLAANNPSPNPNLLHIHIAKQLHKLFTAYQHASLWFLTQRKQYNRQRDKKEI